MSVAGRVRLSRLTVRRKPSSFDGESSGEMGTQLRSSRFNETQWAKKSEPTTVSDVIADKSAASKLSIPPRK
jgi:hypothetical protein